MDEVVGLHLKDYWGEPMKVISLLVRGGYVLQQTLKILDLFWDDCSALVNNRMQGIPLFTRA